MTTVSKCPKCGSTNMKHVHMSSGEYWECEACGYAGSITHKEEQTDHMISW